MCCSFTITKAMSIPSQEDSHATFLELGGANRMYPHFKFKLIMSYDNMSDLARYIQVGLPQIYSNGKRNGGNGR